MFCHDVARQCLRNLEETPILSKIIPIVKIGPQIGKREQPVALYFQCY